MPEIFPPLFRKKPVALDNSFGMCPMVSAVSLLLFFIFKKWKVEWLTTANIPIAPVLLNEIKLDFQRKYRNFKHGMQFQKNSGILTKHFSPMFAQESEPITHKAFLMFHLLVTGRKCKLLVLSLSPYQASFYRCPMQLIYQGTTDRCLPKGVEFPDDWNATCTANHWSNEEK